MSATRVSFRYSWVYDQVWKRFLPKNSKEMNQYPTPNQVKSQMLVKEKAWRIHEKVIVNAIPSITALKWQEKEIRCYVVGFCRPFSDPLTMMPYKSDKMFVDVLTHELIHQIQVQNLDMSRNFRKWLIKRYPNESTITINHVALYAIYETLYLKLFGKTRLKESLSKVKLQEYLRALEIVNQEGCSEILSRFINYGASE